MKRLIEEGLYVQVNITASRLNYDEVLDVIRFSDKLGAHVVLLYHFVASSRGERSRRLGLSPEERVKSAQQVLTLQRELGLLAVPIALPWYYACFVQKIGLSPSSARKWIKGCIAARGMYIKPNGNVWPCPFLPIKAGNAAEQPAVEMRRGSASSFGGRKVHQGRLGRSPTGRWGRCSKPRAVGLDGCGRGGRPKVRGTTLQGQTVTSSMR